ncbi:DUF4097 family beta strand repeat-containing protein [Marinactinospora rubrisoli]|uniref:DUF4097 domain-containing protein n=1 Tax=Marinactinospora rubrisoli TaxID=2715399 RepID=A0ABW2KFK1_9ACTN
MPTFDTPEPISVSLEFDAGSVRISAGPRADTVVEVLPSDPGAEADVTAARQTRVTCSDGRLLVKGPRKRSLFGRSGSLAIDIELPAGSDVRAHSPMADFTCEGRFGDCKLTTSFGDIVLDEAATAHLRSAHGEIRLGRVRGDASVAGAGQIDVGEIAGAATVRNGNGATVIGEVTGDLRVNSANGRISVGVAHAGVEATSANGGIRIGEVARGQVSLRTAVGDLEVGVRASTAAWLDVNTGRGGVHNALAAADGPGPSEETVEIHARTGTGDIVIRRS